MKSNLTRLKPRQGTYEISLEAYASGDFYVCVDNLIEIDTIEASILRARALVRLGDAASAVESLEVELAGDVTHELAAEFLAVKCYALQVSLQPIEAARVAIEARARCFSSGLATIEGELLFASALGALISQDYEAAKAAAESILSLTDDRPSWMLSKSYGYSLNYWRAKACDIRAAIELMKSNYAGQLSWMSRAFEEFDKADVRDQYTLAAFLANYADAATKLGLEDVAEYAIERADKIEWTPSLVAFEFRVFSALAESASAGGDQLGALRYFRRCLDCAPSAPLQIRASIERARLLREIGESFSAREELDHAVRLSRSVNWEDTNLLEQRQLILLAGQIAHFDARQGERLIARYDGLAKNSLNLVAMRDESFRGEEFVARAAVMKALGSMERAVLLLSDALEIFTAAKLLAKAANAAAELAELTSEPRFVDIARKQCEKQPRSILASKLARLGYNSAIEEIQPAAPNDSVVTNFVRPKLALLS